METVMIVVCLCLFAVFVHRQKDDEASPWVTGAFGMSMSLASYAALVLFYALLWLSLLQFLDMPPRPPFPYREISASMGRAAVPLISAVALVTPLAAMVSPVSGSAMAHVVGVIAVVTAWRARGSEPA
jgi:hypothetical protein